ncbi:MAG: hypothetical protein ACC652_14970 [Acidimicrobiales bacterium]
MLRASAQVTGISLNLLAVGSPTADPLLAGGGELLAFTTALVARDDSRLEQHREQLTSALGPAGTATAAGVAGNFEMMNRLLDATGIPASVDKAFAAELGLSSNWPHGHQGRVRPITDSS